MRDIFRTLLIVISISSLTIAASPRLCCDFEEEDNCDLINTGWWWQGNVSTPYGPPSSGLFMWTNLTDVSLITPTVSVAPSTVYAFDYYLTGYYSVLYAKFRRSSDGRLVDIVYVDDYPDDWTRMELDFNRCFECCYPALSCNGQIMVIAFWDNAYKDSFFAVDNFGLANNCSDQLPVSPTLPLPVHRQACCDFESDVCDDVLYGFKWSVQFEPPTWDPPLPETTSEFVWTDVDESQIITGTHYNVTSDTNFHFLLFLKSSGNSISVNFRDAATEELHQLNVYNDTDQWLLTDNRCKYNCCDAYPCEGQLVIRVTGDSGYDNFLAAIDDISRDEDTCGRYRMAPEVSAGSGFASEQCCDFELDDCAFFVFNTDWKWSAKYNSTVPVPPFDGYYLFTNVYGAQLLTQTIQVTPLTRYSFNFYSSNNGPIISFRRRSDGRVVQVAYVGGTYGEVRNLVIDFGLCVECCDALTCDGQMMIVAGGYGDFVTVIDDFNQMDNCSQGLLGPTLPPPVHHSCCDFESDVCDALLFNFQWSVEATPTSPVPPFDGNFVWSTETYFQLLGSTEGDVSNVTSFQLSLYIQVMNTGYFNVYFRQSDTGQLRELYSTYYTDGQWESLDLVCEDKCCDTYPCDGQIVMKYDAYVSDILIAIDSIGRDGSCGGQTLK